MSQAWSWKVGFALRSDERSQMYEGGKKKKKKKKTACGKLPVYHLPKIWLTSWTCKEGNYTNHPTDYTGVPLDAWNRLATIWMEGRKKSLYINQDFYSCLFTNIAYHELLQNNDSLISCQNLIIIKKESDHHYLKKRQTMDIMEKFSICRGLYRHT